MKAILNYGAGNLRLEEVPIPTLREGRVLIKVLACGVCGGEYSLAKARPGETANVEGVIPGHEIVGAVVASDYEPLAAGVRVVVAPNHARCGVCENCLRGLHICLNWPRRTADIGGGYAEYALVEPRQCYLLPASLDPVDAALTEPLACCLHAMGKLHMQPGAKVIVVGAGANAQLFVQLARLQAASFVAVADNHAERVALAFKLGADAAVDPHSPTPLQDATGSSDGADVVIVTRGAPEALEQAIRWCGYGGRVLVYGVAPPGAPAALEPHLLWRKEISIIGSRSFSNTFAPALDLLVAGRIVVKPLITTLSLEEIIPALRRPLDRVKMVIVPD
jgi:threonine dehydrogenase-like Zn-dependent dehydrogenase